MSANEDVSKVGVRQIRKWAAEGRRIVVVTAYDALLARLVDEVGVDMILVGDSLGMTVLGYETTIPVTLRDCLHHTAAVKRGVKRAMVVADMPFLTYQISPEQALRNAGRLLQEAGADAVKLEGGERMAPTIQRLVECGIPVLGHIGILPQLVKAEGGYRVQGRTPESAAQMRRDAAAVQDAGAFALVLEGLPMALSQEITADSGIPTIGIGAGPHCSGQVQVLHDILGLFEDFVPHHTKRYAAVADQVRQALTAYRDEVRDGRFPTEEQSFT
jgi:3-methyl-2-oxobutanoate hydroxymethyltransferase